MKFDIQNRWDGSVVFTAEIECEEDALLSVKLGLAVRVAVKAGANLARAYLAGVDLAGANLARAYLDGANLAGANLAGVDLDGANLAGSYLAGVDLDGANLAGVDLAGANLARANLAGVDLDGANLAGANLAGAKNAELLKAQTVILPEGDIIGWKKVLTDSGETVCKLLIPAASKRSNATGRKCRAEYATVLDVVGADKGRSPDYGRTGRIITYRAGETVHCHEWDDNRWRECSGGIHFYITREEAEAA